MQNYCKTIGALAAASALVAGNASAEVEYELKAGYSNQYLFRGVDLGDDLVEAGLNAATQVGGIDLSAGLWYGSFDNNTAIGSGEYGIDETDFTLQASKDLGFMTAGIGYVRYSYESINPTLDDDQEVFFNVSRDLGFASASLTYFWDIEDTSSTGDNEGYTELGLSKSYELNSCLNLNVGTNVGYLVEGGDFTAWTTKASLDWAFVENAKLSPFVALSIALGEETQSPWFNTDNEIIAGTALSVSF
jgi:hypothetical protein